MDDLQTRARAALHVTAADAARRIDDWFQRGYVLFSDLHTRSTHLRRVGPDTTAAKR